MKSWCTVISALPSQIGGAGLHQTGVTSIVLEAVRHLVGAQHQCVLRMSILHVLDPLTVSIGTPPPLPLHKFLCLSALQTGYFQDFLSDTTRSCVL